MNRIDEIIMFKPLNKNEIYEIVKLQFNNIRQMLKNNQVNYYCNEEALKYIGKEGYDPQFGARPIKRVMQKSILNELSKMILSEK